MGLFNLYSIRWQIEITFRAWKQSGKLVSALARKSNLVHLQALMLLLILTIKIASLLQKTYRGVLIRIEKLAADLADFILGIKSIWHLADYDPDP